MDQELLVDVEKVISDKNPKLLKTLPGFLIYLLKKILHQDGLNRFAIANADKHGLDYSDAIIKEFGVNVTQSGLEEIPTGGRYIFCANHPLGGLDGVAFIDIVGRKFPDLKFPVNDMLMFVKNFSDIFVPVNKIGQSSWEEANAVNNAFLSDSQILMFPAGLCSRKIKGQIVDLEWKKSFIKKAVQTQRDIVPVHISGRNTSFFYNLSNLRKKLGIKFNIEMVLLPDQMYQQKGKNIHFTFGTPLSWKAFKVKDAKNSAEIVKNIVYSLQ